MTGFQDGLPRQPLPFDELLEHLGSGPGFAHRLARGLLFDEHQADDVVQQAWIAALQTPPTEHVKGWVAKVVRRRAQNVQRDEARRRRRERAVARTEAIPAADEVFAREDERHRMVEAVRALPEPYRQAIVLRYLEERSPKEISEMLGVPAATVRSHIKRGLDRLRDRFDAEHDGDRRGWMLALIPLAKPAALVESAGLGAAPLVVARTSGSAVVRGLAMKKVFGVLTALGVVTLLSSYGLWEWWFPPVGLERGGAEVVRTDTGGPSQADALPGPTEAVAAVVGGRAAVARGDDPELDPFERELARATGRVLAQGRPVVGATVSMVAVRGSRLTAGVGQDGISYVPTEADRGIHRISTQTGEDGRFELARVWPGLSAVLRVAPPAPVRGQPALVPLRRTFGFAAPRSTENIGDIELAVGGSILGKVVDDDNQPLRDAVVSVLPMGGLNTSLLPLELLASDGRVQPTEIIGPLPKVEVGPQGEVLAKHGDRLREYYQQLARPGAVQPLGAGHDLVLARLPDLLLDALGRPPLRTAKTDSSGVFRIDGLVSKKYLLVARHQNRLRRIRRSIQPTIGGVANVGALRLRAGQRLDGVVRDANGQAVAGADIRCASMGRRIFTGLALVDQRATTAADGSFAVGGLQRGKALVAVRRAKGLPWHFQLVETGASCVCSLPPEHSLAIEFRADGQPTAVVGVRVGARRGSLFQDVDALPLDRELAVALEPGSTTGTARLSPLPAGRYTLRLDAPGRVSTVRTVDLPRTTPLVIDWASAVVRHVVVHSGDGQPIAGAEVFARMVTTPPHAERSEQSVDVMMVSAGEPVAAASFSQLVRTNEEGTARLDALGRGAWNLTVVHPGYVARQVSVPAEATRTEVVMGRGGRLTGRIASRDAAGQKVTLRRLTESPTLEEIGQLWTRSGADGRFAIANVPPGRYEAQVEQRPEKHPEEAVGSIFMMYAVQPSPTETVEIVEGQSVEVVLHMQGEKSELIGQFTMDGVAPSGLEATYPMNASGRTATVPLDAAGRFTINEIPTGRQTIRIGRKGERTLWSGAVVVTAGERSKLIVNLRSGTVRGRVVLDGEAPGPGKVVLFGRSVGIDSGVAARRVEVSEDGSFEANVPAGSYSASFRTLACKGRTDARIDVLPGAVTEAVAVPVQRCYRVQGRVPDEVRMGRVWLVPENGRMITADVKDGQFVAEGLLPGRYTVTISVRGERGSFVRYDAIPKVVDWSQPKDRTGVVFRLGGKSTH